MGRKKRRQLSRVDLESSLKEQIGLLLHACESYDKGYEAIGKHIAIILRVLLHNTNRSKALLYQLGLRNIKYYDTAGIVDPNNLLSDCRLVSMRMSSEGGRYIPKMHSHPNIEEYFIIKFAKWWNNPVYQDKNHKTMHRRDLILNIANTDGGGHVDPRLDELYYEFSRKNELGWMFNRGDVVKAFEGRPELACIRQIAYEVLLTMKGEVPHLFPT